MPDVIGANPNDLVQLRDALHRAAGRLAETRNLVERQMRVRWEGPNANRFHQTWQTVHRRKLQLVIDGLESASRTIERQRQEQVGASATGSPLAAAGMLFGGAHSTGATDEARVRSAADHIRGWLDPGGLGVTHGDLEKIRDEFARLSSAERDEVISRLSKEELERLIDQMNEGPFKGGFDDGAKYAFLTMLLPSLSSENVAKLMGKEWATTRWTGTFDASTDPNTFGSQLFMRMYDDGTRQDPIRDDEIEIRDLGNGRYVVVLPGVIDLSMDPRTVREWEATNSWDSARDMRFARRSEMNSDNGAQVGTNAYAFAVKEALHRSGVPAGADVMFVGHSFGAYTAVELATDPSFNDALGGSKSSYHVNVTHVLAGGADVAFRMDDLPTGTNGLLINNIYDVAFGAEAIVTNGNLDEGLRNYANQKPNQTIEVFAGGIDGAGHEVTNYSAYLENPSAAAQSFLDSAAAEYSGSGTVRHVTVKDAYR